VQGNSFSDTYTYFELVIDKCNTFDGACKTDAEITTFLGKTTIDMVLVNTFYDFDDYNDPMKSYLDDRFYFNLLPGYHKENLIYVK
jgi:hypothetical protein